MNPADLNDLIVSAVRDAVAAGDLTLNPNEVPSAVTVERPKNREHGDWATNVAMQLAKPARTNPRTVAEALASRLRAQPGIVSVDIAGPGFLNLTIQASAAAELVRAICEMGADYGRGSACAGQRINVEFISANPTGPLHLGHTRWAAVGDAIASVLDAAGADVTREFYVNDRGSQMDKFGASLDAVAHGEPVPEDGYHGDYVSPLAAAIVAADPDILDRDRSRSRVDFREQGLVLQLAQQRAVLDNFRTHFDRWSSERKLHASGGVERALEQLKAQGHVYEDEGAIWLRTTDFGDDKDRVLVKANGDPTYFASDCAYYIDKRARGYDVNIYLLGADHHGYVARLKAVSAAAGDDPDVAIEVLIGQLVTMVRGGEVVKLSKRSGDMVTLEDLVAEVGVDAARYTLIRYPVDSPITVDLDLISRQTNDNPVFYVQYAHARICSVLRGADALGIAYRRQEFDPGLLTEPAETNLVAVLGEFPRIVGGAAELRQPHRVARYLEELATAYHKFYDNCRVLPRGDDPTTGAHVARLWLCQATRQTLANGLLMLGVSAPERM